MSVDAISFYGVLGMLHLNEKRYSGINDVNIFRICDQAK